VDDRAIVAQLKRGDPEALAAISGKYRARLVEAARSILRDLGEAEDVAQDVLMHLSRMPRVEIETALQSYLEAAARRAAIDRLRRRALDVRASRATARGEPVEGGGEAAARSDDRERVVHELKQLRDPYQSALRMRFLEGLGFPELASRMRTNERTARTWVGRGLSLLRQRARSWK
jgi:RNA polymerase sigma-70 factor (ECF subfamily)